MEVVDLTLDDARVEMGERRAEMGGRRVASGEELRQSKWDCFMRRMMGQQPGVREEASVSSQFDPVDAGQTEMQQHPGGMEQSHFTFSMPSHLELGVGASPKGPAQAAPSEENWTDIRKETSISERVASLVANLESGRLIRRSHREMVRRGWGPKKVRTMLEAYARLDARHKPGAKYESGAQLSDEVTPNTRHVAPTRRFTQNDLYADKLKEAAGVGPATKKRKTGRAAEKKRARLVRAASPEGNLRDPNTLVSGKAQTTTEPRSVKRRQTLPRLAKGARTAVQEKLAAEHMWEKKARKKEMKKAKRAAQKISGKKQPRKIVPKRENHIAHLHALSKIVPPALSKYYGSVLAGVARKQVYKADWEIKRLHCKRCRVFKNPSTSHVDIENLSKKKKEHADVLVQTCTECGAFKRYPQYKQRMVSGRVQPPIIDGN